MTSVLNVDLAAHEILEARRRRVSGTRKRTTGRSPASMRALRLARATATRQVPWYFGGRPAARSACRSASSFCGRAEAVVRVAAGQQLVRVRRVEVQPLGLAIGTVRPADVGPLVPVEPEPAQVLEDARLGLARRSLGVGVLDAQDERAVLAVRQQPVEERRAGVADVQLPGGAGSESYSHTSVGSLQSESGVAVISRSRQSESSVGAQQRDRVGGDRLAAPDGSTPSFVLPFTLTRPASMPSARGDARADRVAVRPDLRALEDDDDVDVLDREAARRGRGASRVRSSSMLDAPFQRGSVSG